MFRRQGGTTTTASGPPKPQVERVPARRNTTLVVGAIVIALVGLLVWKPWDQPGPRPSAVAVLPTSIPNPTVGPTPSTPPPASNEPASPRLSIEPAPLPSPDLAPLGPAGEFTLADAYVPAGVRCHYGRRADGRRYLLGVETLPPVVRVNNPRPEVSDLETMGWRVELQMNRLDTIFDSEWETVARSRRQLARAIAGQPAAFVPLTVSLSGEQAPPSAVFRVLVVVEWYTRNVELAGRDQAIATTYAHGAGTALVRPEGCHAVRLTA